jgi:capsular exopolysaccharide synthesis family protein
MKDLEPIHPQGHPIQPTGPQDFQFVTAGDEFGPPASPLRVKRFFAFLRRFWWVLLITLILSLGAAAAYISWQPPTYVSIGRMWETVKLRLPEGTLFSEDIQNFLGTQAELLKSARLQDLALAALKAGTTNALPTEKDGRPLHVKIQVSQAPKSTVFDVIVTSSDAAYTTAFLNALMNQYLEYKKLVRKDVSGGTLASISSQVLRLESELKSEQDALASFQKTNNLAILQEEGTVSGGYLARLKTQLSDLQLEEHLLKAAAADQERIASQTNKLSEYKRVCDLLDSLSRKRKDLLAQFSPENSWVTQVNEQVAANEKIKAQLEAENPGLETLKLSSEYGPTYAQLMSPNASGGDSIERLNATRELEVLNVQRERLSKYLRPKHPKIVKLDSEIERAQKLLDVFRRQNQQQLTTSMNALQLKMENVQKSIKDWESKVVEANARIAEAEHLKQNVTRSQGLYDRLVLLLENVDISRSIDQETLSILEPASLAMRSYKEDAIAIGLAVVVGLAFGLGIDFLVELRDDRVFSLMEICDKIDENVVGQLPQIKPPARKARVPLVELDDSRYMYAESFRNLRSAILFMPTIGQHRPKVILITSALPNEGKSTVAANLAKTFAMGGAKVVLVDCDLRRGVLHELMGVQCEPGLPQVLREPSALAEVLQTNSMPNLSLISRGNLRSGTSEILLSGALDEVLTRLREQFDYVLIDSSPLLAAEDAATLAPKVDGTILVVRNSISRTSAVREALDALHQRQARVLGIIFNGANGSSGSYQYYKYTEYYSSRTNGEVAGS